MTEPEWLDLDIVLDVHAEQLALFGGADGIRDVGLLESALSRAVNKFAYGELELAALPAAYSFGISRNHPFIDGNKRTAFACVIVFIGLNQVELDAPQEEATAVMLGVAAGEIAEDLFARWIADHSGPSDGLGLAP